MTKIDIISGFLGAGKTTLIKKLIEQAIKGEKLVLIENEFGEIGIDGGFLKDAGVQITEMNSGCICCSLVGDFGTALKQVITDYTPDRIIIEPSGVGKLSDVIKAVKDVSGDLDVELDSYTTVADVAKVKIYMKNFGEFFNNQIESANTIILSRTQTTTQDKIEKAVAMIREKNDHATIITTPWDEIDGAAIREAMQNYKSLEETMMDEAKKGHDHDHDHGDECTCGCHDHELAHDTKVFPLHGMDVFHILICDLNNRNIINIYFIFLNKMHQQIQRTFKHLKLNTYSHICLAIFTVHNYTYHILHKITAVCK